MRRETLLLLQVVGQCALWRLGLGFENMNGEYVTTPTPGASEGEYNTKWSEYPGGVEFFDVYLGPIETVYSQVWWKQFDPVPLPEDIVKRFAGKGIAIVGYETDSVRKKGDKDVDGSILQQDVSVPINIAYVSAPDRLRKFHIE